MLSIGLPVVNVSFRRVRNFGGLAPEPGWLHTSAIRNLVRAGVKETVAMRLSGHRTRSVFDRYNIVSEDDLIDASKKLEAFLAEAVKESKVKPLNQK
jgi:hypothetical protein